MADAKEGVSCRGLGDLPQDCIASILSGTTPKDVARLACVSRVFRDASNADSVWQMMLPPWYADIFAHAPDGSPTSSSSKKQAFYYLCNPVLLENGTQELWLDRDTGGVCRSVGARGLGIVWGDDRRYWSWARKGGARFAESAYLKQVCWLEVRGSLKCFLPVGAYKLSWRLSFAENNVRGFRYPVKLDFEASGNEPVFLEKVFTPPSEEMKRVLGRRGLFTNTNTDGNINWLELDVGEFTVERGDVPMDINFSMFQVEGGYWKMGMCIDCAIICPTPLSKKRENE